VFSLARTRASMAVALMVSADVDGFVGFPVEVDDGQARRLTAVSDKRSVIAAVGYRDAACAARLEDTQFTQANPRAGDEAWGVKWRRRVRLAMDARGRMYVSSRADSGRVLAYVTLWRPPRRSCASVCFNACKSRQFRLCRAIAIAANARHVIYPAPNALVGWIAPIRSGVCESGRLGITPFW